MDNIKGILNFGAMVVEAEIGDEWKLILHWKQDAETDEVMALTFDIANLSVSFEAMGTTKTGTLS